MNVISIDDDTHTLYKYMSIFHVPEIVWLINASYLQ